MTARLRVRVTPRSSRNLVEVREGVVCVWVTASPTDGEANKAVEALLAKALSVAPSSVSVSRGHASRNKVVEVSGLETQEALSRLVSG